MSCTLGYHSDTKCVAVGVWSDPDRCRSDASVESICDAAEAVEHAVGSCAEESAGGGLMWGMILSLVGDVVNKDTTQPGKWERVMRVPMRFNRLVLFSPWQFHNAAPGFGTDAESARLVMLLFFGRAAG